MLEDQLERKDRRLKQVAAVEPQDAEADQRRGADQQGDQRENHHVPCHREYRRQRAQQAGREHKIVVVEGQPRNIRDEDLKDVEPEDLLKYGLIPEFVGRLPVVATLEDLDEPALIQILQQPKNAIVKQYQKLFEMEEVKLTFTEDALLAIAQRAIARNTGARGLRSIMEDILLETMYELPGSTGIEEVVINRDVVEGRAQPLLTYSKKSELKSNQG